MFFYRNKGFSRLQKLGMSVNKITVNRKICEASHDYNEKLKSWKSAIEKKKVLYMIIFMA